MSTATFQPSHGSSRCRIGTTNANALLPNPLEAPIYSAWDDVSAWGTWTGMRPDWTSSIDCSDWRDGTAEATGLPGIIYSTLWYLNNGAYSLCLHSRRLYCVEQ